MYNFIYRLDVDYLIFNESTPLNIDEEDIIEMTDEEAIKKAMGILATEKNIHAWEVTKRWFPKAGGNAVKCEVLASHNIKGSRLEFPRSAFSKID